MNCTVQGCPGEYEPREIVHIVRYHGEVVLIDHVPAEVCSICGDALLPPDAVRRIERILRERKAPARMAPVYEYALLAA